jgi:hypothetical protein
MNGNGRAAWIGGANPIYQPSKQAYVHGPLRAVELLAACYVCKRAALTAQLPLPYVPMSLLRIYRYWQQCPLALVSSAASLDLAESLQYYYRLGECLSIYSLSFVYDYVLLPIDL